ncbi:hypothetical protein [Methylobacterium sp. P5_C11]
MAVDPACAAFEYRKKSRRREYVRLCLERPRKGDGVLTALKESDGRVERPDETTTVAPGDMLTDYPRALPW